MDWYQLGWIVTFLTLLPVITILFKRDMSRSEEINPLGAAFIPVFAMLGAFGWPALVPLLALYVVGRYVIARPYMTFTYWLHGTSREEIEFKKENGFGFDDVEDGGRSGVWRGDTHVAKEMLTKNSPAGVIYPGGYTGVAGPTGPTGANLDPYTEAARAELRQGINVRNSAGASSC